MIPPGSVIGIFGGGQLGRMTALAAAKMGYDTHIYCNSEDSPALYVSRFHTVADYRDEEALRKFSENVDVVTFEFENIPYESVKLIEGRVPVRPSWSLLHISQNRIREKEFALSQGVPTAPFAEVRDLDDLKQAVQRLGFPALLKTAELGYDGKGQFKVDANSDLQEIWRQFGDRQGVLEQYIPFTHEVSCIVARSADGTVAAFPVTQNFHQEGILRTSIAPAQVAQDICNRAQEVTLKLAEAAGLIGLLGVEYFVTKEGKLLFNEMAPRPHNTGHWTMDGCATCQFEQFVRAICGLPLGPTTIHTPIRMENLLGNDIDRWQEIISDPSANLHLYGKKHAAKNRKMGHVNFVS